MIKFELLEWNAITSRGDNRRETISLLQNFDTDNELSENEYPKIPEIAPALRRRLTKLTKLVARLFFDTVPPEVQSKTPMIFLSESGEVQVLEELLSNTLDAEAYSPMKFCNSVHHTPTGYLSIASKNRGVARTISGGVDGFSAALLEVAALLQNDRSTPVVLIVAEEHTPSVFEDCESYNFDYASLFLFGCSKNETSQFTIDDEFLRKTITEKTSLLQFCSPLL